MTVRRRPTPELGPDLPVPSGVRRGPVVASGRDRGAAAVEFALVLPLAMLLVLGVIQFGILFNAQITLTQAAREGVRILALNSPGAAANATTRTQAAAAPTVTGVAVGITSCPANPVSTDAAVLTATKQVTLLQPFRSLMGLTGGTPAASITLTGKGDMRCFG